jgi:mono/diheme cytochrome c family protein
MEQKFLNIYKIISIISGLIFLIFAFLMMYDDVISPEWRTYQDQYAEQVAELKSPSDQNLSGYGIRQIEVKPINHIDRCITCHINIGQTPVDSFPVPFSDHPGDVLKHHDLTTFACTLCHNGSGRSLRRSESCDRIHQSEWRPLESQCARCHLAVFDSTSVKATMPDISLGLMTFIGSGCLGCHKLREVGGPFGPDLTAESKKILKAYNFKNIKGKNTIYNWHDEHFTNPEEVSPGSIMPHYSFSPEVQHALITLVLGFSEPSLPLHYYDLKVIKEFKDQREPIGGKTAYRTFCSSCHGTNGMGQEYKADIFGVPAIANPDFQAIASLDLFSFIINEGRGGRYMPSWRSRHSGMHDTELINLIKYLRQWRKRAPSWQQFEASGFSISEGENLYNQYCSTCHGKDRKGGIGPNLSNNSFLSLATDKFLYQTLTNGRSNTAMPSWSRFEASSLKSLIRFLQPKRKLSLNQSFNQTSSGSIDKGKLTFHYKCRRCHGSDGMGGIGPAILNPDFLEAAEDDFIIGTIKQGRGHTPMFKVEQSESELFDLLAFMRAQKKIIPAYLNPGPSLGNPDLGNELFQQFCAECHGKNGEGIKAPALNNQEFLNAATNGYLLATITLGRAGTPMPAWGYPDKQRHVLTTRERQNIVSQLRKWQKITIRRTPDDPIYRLLELTTENTEE